ncbi:MAG TPA: mechanosensitive ion channel domain-containing protein [Steroidobacteraceae bacterium]|nr:mechanosensitive ion channel domain-containing protein [Steroidobacteraceae bacterium]
MSPLQRAVAAVLVALLLTAGYGVWATRTPPAATAPAQSGSSGMPVIDQSTFLTAQRLARLARTPEERPLAQAAVQTADHDLDLAFAAALRRLEAHPPTLTPQAQQIEQRLEAAQKVLAERTADLKRLTAQLAQAGEAEKQALQDRLQLAQSQLELQQDEVQEANDDLLQAGGNVHQRIEMMQQEHDAAEHSVAPTAAAPPTALSMLHGLVGQLREWLALHDKHRAIAAAQDDVAASAAQLTQERQRLVDELAAAKAQLPSLSAHAPVTAAPATEPGPGPSRPHRTAPRHGPAAAPRAAPPATPGAAAAANDATPVAAAAQGATKPDTVLSLTRRIAADQHRITLRDQRINTRRRLADIYADWDAIVASQARAVLHDVLGGAAVIVVALLLLLFADRWVGRLLGRARIDRRQLATLRSVVGVALQLVGIVIIVLALVGLPGQTATMVGIVGAGLTVALKDLLVAFIGWFVLMGRNGIRLGDWVEINGVSGEVVELNMFHTVLLETGNWSAVGQPTGRRVTFTNSFAIGNHYFNFSTSGQWLWDEVSVMVPYGRDAHAIADAIQKEITEATADDIAQAEQEWRRAARGQGGAAFTAKPVVAVRPATGGVEIVVRYVARASERFALRARLYQAAVQMLAQPAA